MRLMIWRFVAMVCTAITMAAGFTHLLELPRKITLDRDQYLMVQQLYRGWALLGVVVVAALVSTGIAARLTRARRSEFRLTTLAACCLALIVFFLFTFPANQATQNLTVLPDNWESLRRQWEYSHAVGAGFDFLALTALTLSLLVGRD
jgi:mannose/fructose/N-acetylgalactosamine-specific phosphotransferase system component IID